MQSPEEIERKNQEHSNWWKKKMENTEALWAFDKTWVSGLMLLKKIEENQKPRPRRQMRKPIIRFNRKTRKTEVY